MGSKTDELVKTESRVVAARGWGMRDKVRCWSKGAEVQLCRMSKFWDLMYSVVSKVNSTVCTVYLKFAKRVGRVFSPHKIFAMGGDGCVIQLDCGDHSTTYPYSKTSHCTP